MTKVMSLVPMTFTFVKRGKLKRQSCCPAFLAKYISTVQTVKSYLDASIKEAPVCTYCDTHVRRHGVVGDGVSSHVSVSTDILVAALGTQGLCV